MLVNVSSHTMGGFPDKEPGAGWCHISVCLVVTSCACPACPSSEFETKESMAPEFKSIAPR